MLFFIHITILLNKTMIKTTAHVFQHRWFFLDKDLTVNYCNRNKIKKLS